MTEADVETAVDDLFSNDAQSAISTVAQREYRDDYQCGHFSEDLYRDLERLGYDSFKVLLRVTIKDEESTGGTRKINEHGAVGVKFGERQIIIEPQTGRILTRAEAEEFYNDFFKGIYKDSFISFVAMWIKK